MNLNEMNEDIPKKTIDKGWAAMEQLLDTEMPTRRRRRRFIWWWLLLIPATVFGILVYPSLLSADPRPNNSLINKQPAAEKQVKQPMATSAATQSSATLGEQESQAASSNSTEKKVKDRVQGAGTKSTATMGIENSVPVSVPPNGGTPKGVLYSPDAPLNPAPVNSAVSPAEENPSADVQLLTATYPPPVQRTVVPTIQLPQQTVAPVDAEQKTPPKRPISRWAAGIGATASAEGWTAPNGFSGGVQGRFQLSSRWRLHAGLHYAKYFWPVNHIQPVVIVTPDAFNQSIDTSLYWLKDDQGNVLSTPGNVSVDHLIQDQVIVPVKQLKAIEMPVWVSWKAWRGWNLLGGARVSYAQYLMTAEKIYSGGLTVEAKSPTAGQSLNSLLTTQSEKWRFDALAGLGFKWNKHLDMFLMAGVPLEKINAAIGRDKVEASLDNNTFDPIGNVRQERSSTWMLGLNYWF